MSTKRKRIVITGGAGFLGSHICGRLLGMAHRVCCLDNLSTGSRLNIDSLGENPNFQFLFHDVSQPIHVDGEVDAVLHFASAASPLDYLRFPIETMKAGSLGTLHALGLAKARKARFLLASSSEIYGDPETSPQVESYCGRVNPVGPRSVYNEAKRFAEALTFAYHRSHGIDVRIARIFNTYGPQMRRSDGRVVSNFIVQALQGRDITIYGDGSQTRSFCYVSDLVEGILRLLFLTGSNRQKARRQSLDDIHLPVNLGNPSELSITELARVIVRLTQSQSRTVHRPPPEDDPRIRRPEITRARKLLGWGPTVKMEDGLRKTIRFFKKAI